LSRPTGAVVPSVILRKLAAAGAGIVLSRALRALGRIERTLFTLQWLFRSQAKRDRRKSGSTESNPVGVPRSASDMPDVIASKVSFAPNHV
jgi:hypothetical protein